MIGKPRDGSQNSREVLYPLSYKFLDRYLTGIQQVPDNTYFVFPDTYNYRCNIQMLIFGPCLKHR